MTVGTTIAYEILSVSLAYDRVESLESSITFTLGTSRLNVLQKLVWIAGALYFLAITIPSRCFKTDALEQLIMPIMWVGTFLFALSLVAFTGGAVYALREPLISAKLASHGLKGLPEEEAKVALNTLRRQAFGIPCCQMLFMLRFLLAYSSRWMHKDEDIIVSWQTLLEASFVLNAAGVMFLSSATHAVRPDPQMVTAMRERRRRQALNREIWNPCSDRRWQEKVHELAGRGITLKALLDFYVNLPSVLPHFSPDLHATRDVVRQAIIPLSLRGARRGCSMATIMMNGDYVRPMKMVTHYWGNLFRDLIAAVVADALEESDFGSIAVLLERNPEGLVCLLEARGKLQDTYWICAFAVSQHSSICGSNPGQDVDPVTGNPHLTCPCGTAKYFNNDEPVREDGKSIHCEMNKFSDMISYLAATDHDFEQVVAADSDMRIFTRAWAIAEIAQSYNMGMPQHLKLRSSAVLDEHAEEMKAMKVENMQASRKEDVAEILAGIPNKRAFNRHLQDVVFNTCDGLVASWRGLDAAQRMDRAGRIARIVLASPTAARRQRKY